MVEQHQDTGGSTLAIKVRSANPLDQSLSSQSGHGATRSSTTSLHDRQDVTSTTHVAVVEDFEAALATSQSDAGFLAQKKMTSANNSKWI